MVDEKKTEQKDPPKTVAKATKAEAKAEPKKKAMSALARGTAVAKKAFKKKPLPMADLDPSKLLKSKPHLPTGSVVIDYLVGGRPNSRGVLPCPGFPKGALVNLYGHESSGKTTLALTVAANTCANGGVVAFIDWEHAVDLSYAKALGVPIEDPDSFLLLQPMSLEDGIKLIHTYARAGVDLIIIDSVGAGVPQAVLDQKVEEKGEQGRVGLAAQRWSGFIPELKAWIEKMQVCVIGISQLRQKMSTGGSGFSSGPKTHAQGGEVWKFASDVRMTLRKIYTEKGQVYDPIQNKNVEQPVANVVRAKLDKCKVAATQGSEADFVIVYGEGIDDLRSIISTAASHGIVNKSGAWYTWERADGTAIKGQGMVQFKRKVREAPGATKELYTMTIRRIGEAASAVKLVEPLDEEEEDLDLGFE